MRQYTIDGVTHLPFSNALYAVGDEVTELSDLEEGQKYLHNEMVGVFELPADYMAFDAVFVPMENPDNRYRYKDGDGQLGDEFDGAVELSRVASDGECACPNCHTPVTPDDEDADANLTNDEDFSNKFTCYSCGLGTPDGVYSEREEVEP